MASSEVRVPKAFLEACAKLYRRLVDDFTSKGESGLDAKRSAQAQLYRLLIPRFVQGIGQSIASGVIPLACSPLGNPTFETMFDETMARFDFTIREEAPCAGDTPIGPEVLGRIFETLILPDGNRRKATGSFYTPRPIVDFMCREAVKEHLVFVLTMNGALEAAVASEKVSALLALPRPDRLREEQRAEIRSFLTEHEATLLRRAIFACRVCDPSVGSGAFAIGMLHTMAAAVSLLDLRLDGPGFLEKHNYDYALKRRLFAACLYGVDVEEQAVWLCKLRLQLALLAAYQPDPHKLHPEAVPQLPDLSGQFVQGDSLLNRPSGNGAPAFDWRVSFAEVFAAGGGGFDIVIVNPPYGARMARADWDEVCSIYPNCRSAKNSAAAFLALPKSIGSKNAIVCQIVPKSLTYSAGWSETRSVIRRDFALLSTADVSQGFAGVLLEQEVVVYSRTPSRRGDVRADSAAGSKMAAPQPALISTANSLDAIYDHLTPVGAGLLRRLSEENPVLGDFFVVKRGRGWQGQLSTNPTESTLRVIAGAHVRQFHISPNLPSLDGQSGIVRQLREMMQPKLVCQNILAHVRNPFDTLVAMCAVDRQGCAALDTVNMVFPKPDCPYSLDFLCGLLNSSFARWFFYFVVYNRAVRTVHFDRPYVCRLPVPRGAKDRRVEEIGAIVCQLEQPGSTKKYFLPGEDERFDALDALVCDLNELSGAERTEVLRIAR